MGYYGYLRERDDGDFDHIRVDSDGTETVISIVPAADKDYPHGRPEDSEVEEKMRLKRNDFLQETDWWASADLTMTQAQIDYRQALRDLSNHANWPHLNEDDWPTKP